jgi:hypothetical protein
LQGLLDEAAACAAGSTKHEEFHRSAMSVSL